MSSKVKIGTSFYFLNMGIGEMDGNVLITIFNNYYNGTESLYLRMLINHHSCFFDTCHINLHFKTNVCLFINNVLISVEWI